MSVYVAGVVIPGPNFVALALSHAGIASAHRRGNAWADRLCGALIVAPGVRQLPR